MNKIHLALVAIFLLFMSNGVSPIEMSEYQLLLFLNAIGVMSLSFVLPLLESDNE